MAKRKVIWSNKAKIKLYTILEFYTVRNKSNSYSVKLIRKLNKEVNVLLKHPDIGQISEIESVRGLIVEDYILFYEYDNDCLIIHSIWDCRQNPGDIKIK